MNNKTSSRIELIDAIRGFALMGLFLVHMVEYFELYWYSPEPGWVHNWVFGAFGGKAYALFALMFGVSCYILLEQPNSKASLSHWRYAWRMLLLWGMGYLHSLLYAGEILQILAIGGLLMLLLHRLSTKKLVALAVVFLLQVPFVIQYLIILPDTAYGQPKFWAAFSANFEQFAHADFLSLVQYNAAAGQVPKWIMNYETGALWNFLGLFFVGLVLARSGFFYSVLSSMQLLLATVGLIVVAVVCFHFRDVWGPSFHPRMHQWVFEEALGRIGKFAMVGGYVLGLMLLYRHPLIRRLIGTFAPCGRASLSLYVLQSVVFVPVFYGLGLGWYDSIGQPAALVLGVLAWLGQMALAHWWLKKAAYAPLEYCWRSVTRLGGQPHSTPKPLM